MLNCYCTSFLRLHAIYVKSKAFKQLHSIFNLIAKVQICTHHNNLFGYKRKIILIAVCSTYIGALLFLGKLIQLGSVLDE